MANLTQPKNKTSTYTGLEVDDQYTADGLSSPVPSARDSSSTGIIVLIALAVLSVLGYFYFTGTPATTTVVPPLVTQESTPSQPVPADPPPATVQDPVPVTPAPAPLAPAPVAPAN